MMTGPRSSIVVETGKVVVDILGVDVCGGSSIDFENRPKKTALVKRALKIAPKESLKKGHMYRDRRQDVASEMEGN